MYIGYDKNDHKVKTIPQPNFTRRCKSISNKCPNQEAPDSPSHHRTRRKHQFRMNHTPTTTTTYNATLISHLTLKWRIDLKIGSIPTSTYDEWTHNCLPNPTTHRQVQLQWGTLWRSNFRVSWLWSPTHPTPSPESTELWRASTHDKKRNPCLLSLSMSSPYLIVHGTHIVNMSSKTIISLLIRPHPVTTNHIIQTRTILLSRICSVGL